MGMAQVTRAAPETLEEDHLAHRVIDVQDLHQVLAMPEPRAGVDLFAQVSRTAVPQERHAVAFGLPTYDMVTYQ
jgi:hypothetical protein